MIPAIRLLSMMKPAVAKTNTTRARFIPPMLLLRTERLPEGRNWLYELKLDGYRAIAAKARGRVHLWSRNENDFAHRYPTIADALAPLPDETVIDGEIVALDEAGKPSFNSLQNYKADHPLLYYVFDVPILSGRDLRAEPLDIRRKLLEEKVLPLLSDPIRRTPALEGSLNDLIEAVRGLGLEGLVAKGRDSRYEAGTRSGAWAKMRVNDGRSSSSVATLSVDGRSMR